MIKTMQSIFSFVLPYVSPSFQDKSLILLILFAEAGPGSFKQSLMHLVHSEASPLGRALQTAVIAYGPILAKATLFLKLQIRQCHAILSGHTAIRP